MTLQNFKTRALPDIPEAEIGLYFDMKIEYYLYSEYLVHPVKVTIAIHRTKEYLTLGDFKALTNRYNYRYFFLSFEKYFGLVKEEIFLNDDIIPSCGPKIKAWLYNKETSITPWPKDSQHRSYETISDPHSLTKISYINQTEKRQKSLEYLWNVDPFQSETRYQFARSGIFTEDVRYDLEQMDRHGNQQINRYGDQHIHRHGNQQINRLDDRQMNRQDNRKINRHNNRHMGRHGNQQMNRHGNQHMTNHRKRHTTTNQREGHQLVSSTGKRSPTISPSLVGCNNSRNISGSSKSLFDLSVTDDSTYTADRPRGPASSSFNVSLQTQKDIGKEATPTDSSGFSKSERLCDYSNYTENIRYTSGPSRVLSNSECVKDTEEDTPPGDGVESLINFPVNESKFEKMRDYSDDIRHAPATSSCQLKSESRKCRGQERMLGASVESLINFPVNEKGFGRFSNKASFDDNVCPELRSSQPTFNTISSSNTPITESGDKDQTYPPYNLERLGPTCIHTKAPRKIMDSVLSGNRPQSWFSETRYSAAFPSWMLRQPRINRRRISDSCLSLCEFEMRGDIGSMFNVSPVERDVEDILSDSVRSLCNFSMLE